jgi:hypothetical protein
MRGRIVTVATVAACLMATTPALAIEDTLDNGGFEDPNIASWSWSYFDSIPGWTPTNSCKIEVQDHPDYAREGSQFVELNSNCAGGIRQGVELGVTGKIWKLSFKASPRPGTLAQDNVLRVVHPRGYQTYQLGAGGTTPNWQHFEFEFFTTTAVATFTFNSIGTNPLGGAYGVLLDDVRLTWTGRWKEYSGERGCWWIYRCV